MLLYILTNLNLLGTDTMFKYTPKKSILRRMSVARVGKWWDKQYFVRLEIVNENFKGQIQQVYPLVVALAANYPFVCFYSKERRRYVPVNGYLFPVSMFEETEESN